MTETERREASESLNEWLMQQPGISTSTSSSVTDTVFYDDFSEWFSFTLFPDLHNCVGDRLFDYSLSTSLHTNRAAIPKRQLDKKLDKKAVSQQRLKKQHKPPRRGSKVPYQKDLLHPADLLSNQINYNHYYVEEDNSDSDGNGDDSSYPVVSTRIRGLGLPPRVQPPPPSPLDSSMSFLNLFGDLVSPSSQTTQQSEPEHNTALPSFNRPRVLPSYSFMHHQPPTINVPPINNNFENAVSVENADPFYHSSTLRRMPKPIRNDSFYSIYMAESEESVNNQPNSPNIIKKSKKYFSWM